MEKLGTLQNFAKQIQGIGPCTVDETILWIENDEEYVQQYGMTYEKKYLIKGLEPLGLLLLLLAFGWQTNKRIIQSSALLNEWGF